MDLFWMFLIRILTILLVFNPYCGANFKDDLTISVDPGRTDCFFQSINEGQNIDIEFQVIDGGHGSLDIVFLIGAPNGRIITSMSRRHAGVYRGKAASTGDYRFCFDNSHSKLNSKIIYFDLYIENDDSKEEEEDDNADGNENEGTLTSEDLALIDSSLDSLGDGSMRRIAETAMRIKLSLIKAQRLQENSAATASRDKHLLDKNLSRVTVYSSVQALMMLLVGALQVFMVRSLFDDNSRVRSVLKKLTNGKY